MQKIKADVVMVSDIHIIDPDDSRALELEKLVKLLIKSDVECFILMGDIFDFILGTGSYFDRKFNRISSLLKDLADSGTRVIFLEGNHEFRSRELKWADVEFIDEGSLKLEEYDLVVTHGDMIKVDKNYFMFRRFIRSSFITQLARLIPGAMLNKLALYLSALSRDSEDYSKIPIKQIGNSIEKWQIEQDATFAVCGHFHIPYAEQTVKGTYYCMKWWGQQANALVLHNNEMKRMFWDSKGIRFEDCVSLYES